MKINLIGDIVESEKFCKDILYHQTNLLIFKFFPVKYVFGIHKNFAIIYINSNIAYCFVINGFGL